MKKILALLFLLISSCAVKGFIVSDPDPVFQTPALTWKKQRLPLHVQVTDLLDADPVFDAVHHFNRQVGCELFVLGGGSDVTIKLSPFYPHQYPYVSGRTWGIHIGKENQAARIELFGTVSSLEIFVVSFHELGHVLGLAHDVRSHTIMMPNAGDMANMFPPLRLSDEAAIALKQIYCEKGK